jgi:flagellar biosynthesis regulator FlaF
MTSKHLAIISKQTNTENLPDRIDQFIDQVLEPDAFNNCTAEEILNNPQVKKHGILGHLSPNQQSLVTSVVSIMQDQMLTNAQKHASALRKIIVSERQALRSMSNSLTATARDLYKLPLLRTARTPSPEPVDEQEPSATPDHHEEPQPAEHWSRFITWGNLITLTTVLLAALVIRASINSANVETHYQYAQKDLKQFEASHAALGADHASLKTAYSTLQASRSELNAAYTQLSSSYEAMRAKQQALTRGNANLTKSLNENKLLFQQQNKVRQSLIESQQTRISNLEKISQSEKDVLNRKISTLQQELANLKGKESQLQSNDRFWQRLAEERKVEINTLQQELRNNISQSEKVKRNGLWNIF